MNYRVTCDDCAAFRPIALSEDKAIELWNRRPMEDYLSVTTFTGITQSRFDAIAAKVLALSGVNINGSCGIAESKGYKISWLFAPATGNLSITVLEHPFFVPTTFVTSKIAAIVDDTAGA